MKRLISNRRKYITVILVISILVTLAIVQKVYAQYILTREFTADITTAPFNVEVINNQIDIYNADINKVSATIANHNNYEISGTITFNGHTLKTFNLAAGASEEMTNLALTKEMLNGLSTGTYNLSVNTTLPYTTTINNIKVNVVGTFSNIEKYGVKVSGTDTDPYVVYAIEDLVRFAQKVNSGTTYSGKTVAQSRNLDFSSDNSYYNSKDTSFGNLNNTSDGNAIKTEMTTGTGFIGIGIKEETAAETAAKAFYGKYDGKQNQISNLYINSTTAVKRIGLFGYINGATIQNLGITGTITTNGDTGGLVGMALNTCTIKNCYNKASITASVTDYSLSGLVGATYQNSTITITDCYNTGNITSGTSAAGLVAFVWASTVNVERCYNTGNITCTGTLTNTYTGAAGLIVRDNNSTGNINISKSYNKGKIKGYTNVGGLVAISNGQLTITDSYNIGEVTGNGKIGGLLGNKNSAISTKITNSYSAGKITASLATKGGMIGYKASGTPTITNSYYLSTIATQAIYNTTDTNSTMRRTDMTSQSFVSMLGSNFKLNTGGYPKLTWE